MTTSQLDHLRAIDAHLERLLAIAEKRTPGEWQQGDSRQEMNMDMVYRKPHEHGQAAGIPTFGRNSGLSREQDEADAAFIASCAGNAEAGWRATRAAIAEILASHTARYESWCMVCRELNQKEPGRLEDYPLPPWSEDILAAFPLESLK